MTQFFSFRSQENKLAKLKMIRNNNLVTYWGCRIGLFYLSFAATIFFCLRRWCKFTFAAKMCSVVIIFDSFSCLGRVVLPNGMNFEKNPNGLRLPPPSFLKNCIAIFHDRYGCIYARRYDGSLNSEVPSSTCALFWVLSIQLLKKHILNP